MTGDPLRQLDRLASFVDSFADCFTRKKHVNIGQDYVRGVVTDAQRKNMHGMWERLASATPYQQFQHFITHSKWEADRVWQRLRERCPDREGVLVIDDTGIPKKGEQSVGVQRQYSGTLGKIGNCQVVVSAVLRASEGIWPLGMRLYLPGSWSSDVTKREASSIPESAAFQEKWKIAHDIIDAALADGYEPYCVAADAAYGECNAFRKGLRERGLHYAVGINRNQKVFEKPPRFIRPSRSKRTKIGRPKTSAKLAASNPEPVTVESLAAKADASDWIEISWRESTQTRNGKRQELTAEFLALRVTPSHGWHKGMQHEICWLLCERPVGSDAVRKYHLSSLPEDIALDDLVWATHERWAIEHNYKQLKGELGLDHFEGRSYPGLHRHMALTAIAYYFLERERQESQQNERPTLNQIRRVITELLTMLYIANDPRAREIMIAILGRSPP